jgi:uncharacterized protein
MPEIVQDIMIPARHGKAFVVKKGQILRIIEVDGIQVADCTFINANDHREGYHAGQSVGLNMHEGIGTMRRLTKLYSKPPRENVMLTVVHDPIGVHFVWNGGRCSRKIYALRDGIDTYHRSCQENLEEALAPFGIAPDDVPDVFNAFMNVDIINEEKMVFNPPLTKPGDYIDLRAEMDILAAISACPSDVSASTGFNPKRIQVHILE